MFEKYRNIQAISKIDMLDGNKSLHIDLDRCIIGIQIDQ